MNRWIHDQSGFTGSFDAPWSRQILDHWSWSRSPQRNTAWLLIVITDIIFVLLWYLYVFLRRRRSFTSWKLYVWLETFLCFLQLSDRAYLSRARCIDVKVYSLFGRFGKCSCLRAIPLTVLRAVYAIVRLSKDVPYSGEMSHRYQNFRAINLPHFAPLLKYFRQPRSQGIVSTSSKK